MLKPGFEPISGYRLRSKLGAGGYGEVWLCDAPGGLQKAIKFIFGALSGPQASKELRSLERITKVNHPFLLSIERIEAVGDQLLIVTELAEHSLEDRLRLCRREGRSGLPRHELLQCMRDAAEALDFLATEHSLQHLDVKPANLLVVSKRIKVADFGLLKDLQAVQQSCIGGMTPAYTAPEVFDGCPDFRSDQYSLAITFIELLTGSLPFSGNTLASLAKQHLREAPNLDVLPPGDREVVARAMHKHPLDRYANCRQFIDQLMNVKATMIPGPATSAKQEDDEANTTTAVGVDTNHQFAPVYAQGTEKQLPSEIPAPMLTIGLGGLGGSALAELRGRQQDQPAARFFYIDTDLSELNRYTAELDEGDPRRLKTEEFMHLRLEKPEVYRGASPQRFQSISRRWMYNVPRSRQTEGIRPLGLLTLLHHQEYVAANIQQHVQQLVADQSVKSIRVQILSSLHGATGSGLLAAIAFLLDQISTTSGVTIETEALISVAESAYSGPAKMAPAAALSTLAEFDAYFDSNTLCPPLFSEQSGQSVSRTSVPIKHVIASHGGCLGDVTDVHRATEALANLAEFRFLLPDWELPEKSEENGWLTAAHVTKLELPSELSTTSLGVFCVLRGLARLRDSLMAQKGTTVPKNAGMDGLVDQMFATLGLSGSDAERADVLLPLVAQFSEPEKTQNGNPAIAECISKIHTIVYEALMGSRVTWHQADLVLAESAQALVELSEEPASAVGCLSILPAYSKPAQQTNVRDILTERLQELAVALIEYAQQFRQSGKDYATRINTCGNEIARRIPAQQGSELTTLVRESQPLQSLVSIVAEHLQTVLTQSLPISPAVGALETTQRSVQPMREFNVGQLMAEATAQIKKLCGRFEITLNDQDQGNAARQAAKVVEKLELSLPPLARCGGHIARQVVGKTKQLNKLKEMLAKGNGKHVLDETTFAHWDDAICERHNWIISHAAALPLELLIRNLWRPAADTLKLAEKLRSRVDIDWPGLDQLLAPKPPPQSAEVSSQVQEGNTACLDDGQPAVNISESMPFPAALPSSETC